MLPKKSETETCLGRSISGSFRDDTLKALFAYLKAECDFGQDSVFLDIGAGAGFPCFLFETLDSNAVFVGVESDWCQWLKSAASHQEQVEKKLGGADRSRCCFLMADVFSLSTFVPVTHVFSFDTAFSPFELRRIGELVGSSESVKYYITCQRGATKCSWVPGDLVKQFTGKMEKSTSTRQINVFRIQRSGIRVEKIPSDCGSLETAVLAFGDPIPKNVLCRAVYDTDMPLELRLLRILSDQQLVQDALHTSGRRLKRGAHDEAPKRFLAQCIMFYTAREQERRRFHQAIEAATDEEVPAALREWEEYCARDASLTELGVDLAPTNTPPTVLSHGRLMREMFVALVTQVSQQRQTTAKKCRR
eukprot:GDKH01002101.1.p1 GENE.GDKH01002101.1~~GDKH01002101.1.p1  ORF type:complete len:362 (-),score=14.45 GDKH01002101.1:251-1336(-)